MGPVLAFVAVYLLLDGTPPWVVATGVVAVSAGYFLGAWLDEVVG